jgi:hypothetical protein
VDDDVKIEDNYFDGVFESSQENMQKVQSHTQKFIGGALALLAF